MNTGNNMEEEQFVVVEEFAAGSFQGIFHTSYSNLVAVLGQPVTDGLDKVTSEWTLKDTMTGELWRIYDFKATSVYDSSRNMPSLEEFRALPSYGWHIGGESSRFQDLIAWLNSKIRAL